jgi:DNA-binding LacI/PurR family transcriptional regulator
MNQRANTYHIGRLAGVSRTVVSLVLNGKADKYRIARETQERVRKAAMETGYTPNMAIRNLFLKRREAIGVGAWTDSVADTVKGAIASAGLPLKSVVLSNEPTEALAQMADAVHSGMATLIVPMAPAPQFSARTASTLEPTPQPAQVHAPAVKPVSAPVDPQTGA